MTTTPLLPSISKLQEIANVLMNARAAISEGEELA